MIFPTGITGSYKMPGTYDPDSQRIIEQVLRPPAWAATTFKGLYFRVKHPGKSGATDPFNGTYEAGDEVEDGTITWEAVNYDLMGIAVTIASITVTATHSITIATSSATTTTATFTVPAISAAAEAAGYFEVTLRVTTSTGEITDYTRYFKVGER